MKIKPNILLALLLTVVSLKLQAQSADPALVVDLLAENYYMPSITVALGTFTFEYSDLPTPFARWLEENLLSSASRLKRVQLVNRRAAAAMDPAFQAQYAEFFRETGTQGLLYGTYHEDAQGVRVELKLSDLCFMSSEIPGIQQYCFPKIITGNSRVSSTRFFR